MNADQIGGLVRTLIAFAGGIAVGKGWGDAALWDIVGGAVAGIAAWVWSHYSKTATTATTATKDA